MSRSSGVPHSDALPATCHEWLHPETFTRAGILGAVDQWLTDVHKPITATTEDAVRSAVNEGCGLNGGDEPARTPNQAADELYLGGQLDVAP